LTVVGGFATCVAFFGILATVGILNISLGGTLKKKEYIFKKWIYYRIIHGLLITTQNKVSIRN